VSLEAAQLLGGRYRLVEPIGYGGMGRVFRAHDELLDRAVAVKLLDQSALDASEIAEARAAARLSHPGVVHVFDVGLAEPGGRGYIVMEMVPGHTLRDILRDRGRLPADEAAHLAAQLADALDAMHRLDIVHCDVKPLNVIVTPLGHTKLVDFGIARATADKPHAENLGSAAYVSPEQARGEGVDARSDIYALGAVLYEMLTGARPFAGENAAQIISRRLSADPPPPRSLDPRIPRDLEMITLRALAREPSQRFASAADMRDALRAAIARASDTTQVIPRIGTPNIETLRVPPLRAPRLALIAFAVLVVCLLTVGGWRLSHPTNHGVPRLVGTRLSEVPAALEDAGFAPADVTILTRPVESQYVGTVVDQQPQPGLPPTGDDALQIAVGVSQ
jgi:serine/threonine-protein kinase